MNHQSAAIADCGLPHFMKALPFDVVTKIFARLSQQDCLRCMTANRAMYESVPWYSTELWRKVRLYQRSIHDKLLVRCLGPHVDHVTLASCRWEDEAHALLQMLVDRGCMDIGSIEFSDCYIINMKALMQRLAPFRRLRRLAFVQHPRPLVPEQVIVHCASTNITHLAVEVDHDAGSEQIATVPPPRSPSSSQQGCSNKIVYLRWQDYRLKYYLFEDMVAPTLRHCPNLRYFSASSAIIRRRVALVDILQLCPKLRMFETTSWWEGYKDDICAALEQGEQNGYDDSENDRHPLRYLSLEGSFDDDGNHDDPQSQIAFARCIKEQFQSLQYVMLTSASTFALRALTRLERLTALRLRLPISWENNVTPEDLVHLFTKLSASATLQMLNLEAARFTTPPVLEAVADLKSLQLLNIQLAADLQDSDLAAFAAKLIYLDALTLHGVHNVSKNLLAVIANLERLSALTLDDCGDVDADGIRLLIDKKADTLAVREKPQQQFVLHTMYTRISKDDGIEEYAKDTPGVVFISS